MKAIDRKLLFHLVDIVWGDAFEDESVPSTEHARELIQKAIERRRQEKYSKQKLNLPFDSKTERGICVLPNFDKQGICFKCGKSWNNH